MPDDTNKEELKQTLKDNLTIWVLRGPQDEDGTEFKISIDFEGETIDTDTFYI